MNQHFRNALKRFAEDAVVPPELQIANKWIETVVINAFVGGEASSFLPAKRRARNVWSIGPFHFGITPRGGGFYSKGSFNQKNANFGPGQSFLVFPCLFV